MLQLGIPVIVYSPIQYITRCDVQSRDWLHTHSLQMYDETMYVTVNMDVHHQLSSVCDSFYYRPSIAITTGHHTIYSQYSPLSMSHHLQN